MNHFDIELHGYYGHSGCCCSVVIGYVMSNLLLQDEEKFIPIVQSDLLGIQSLQRDRGW